MDELDEMVDAMRSSGRRVVFFGAASEESISMVEGAMGFRLPPSYRQFLLQYGGGGVSADVPVAGIYANQPLLEGAGSVYGETADARREFGIPGTCAVIFRDDDTGVMWCIDASRRSSDGECPVVSIDPATGRVDQEIAPDFKAFIVEHFRLRSKL